MGDSHDGRGKEQWGGDCHEGGRGKRMVDLAWVDYHDGSGGGGDTTMDNWGGERTKDKGARPVITTVRGGGGHKEEPACLITLSAL